MDAWGIAIGCPGSSRSTCGDHMRRTTRPRLLAIWLLFGAASISPGLATAATPATAPAGADDADSCAKASGDAAIAACTRAIASGNYHGHALEKLYHDRAFEYYNKGANDHAIADYAEAIRLDPNHAAALNNRGNAWQAKGDNDRAIADFDEAIRLNPRDPCPLYNRGNAWQAKGDNDRAIADY